MRHTPAMFFKRILLFLVCVFVFFGICTAPVSAESVIPSNNVIGLSYPDPQGQIFIPDEAAQGGSFPVYIHLHGLKRNGYGNVFPTQIKRAIANGQIPPMIVVSPRSGIGAWGVSWNDGVNYEFPKLLGAINQAIRDAGIQGVQIDPSRIIVEGHSNATHELVGIHQIIRKYGSNILAAIIADGNFTGKAANSIAQANLPTYLFGIVGKNNGSIRAWQEIMIPSGAEVEYNGIPACANNNPFPSCIKHANKNIFLFEANPTANGVHNNTVLWSMTHVAGHVLATAQSAQATISTISSNPGSTIISAQTDDQPIPPDIQIQIPGFDPQSTELVTIIDQQGELVQVPYLGQYIVAVFNFAMTAIAIIAVIMVIIAGFEWTISRGNAAHIGAAKKRIGNAVAAVIIAAGSYTMLYLVNPDLIAFEPLQIRRVQENNFESAVFSDNTPIQTSAQPIGNVSEFDVYYRDFAACVNVSPLAYRAMVKKESAGNAEIVNGNGYTGLFQIGPKWCAGALRSYEPWAALCIDTNTNNNTEAQRALKKPILNIAVATAMLESNLKKIQTLCADSVTQSNRTIPADVHLMLAYYAHNSGGKALTETINGAISGSSGFDASHTAMQGSLQNSPCMSSSVLEQAIYDYWYQYDLTKNVSPAQAHRQASTRQASVRQVAQYGREYGMTSFITTETTGTCPLNTNPGTYQPST